MLYSEMTTIKVSADAFVKDFPNQTVARQHFASVQPSVYIPLAQLGSEIKDELVLVLTRVADENAGSFHATFFVWLVPRSLSGFCSGMKGPPRFLPDDGLSPRPCSSSRAPS
jgi:hypothetical protein